MATITISTQILDGNLGEGWKDNYETALALAEYTEAIWENDLAEYANEHEIKFYIDVELNTSGSSRSVCVEIEDSDIDDEDVYDMIQKIENTLTDEGQIWERFCSSDEASEYKNETMKTAKEMAEEIAASKSEYVTYGDSDLGVPIKKEDAIADILSMDDESIGEGTWYECDADGNITE